VLFQILIKQRYIQIAVLCKLKYQLFWSNEHSLITGKATSACSERVSVIKAALKEFSDFYQAAISKDEWCDIVLTAKSTGAILPANCRLNKVLQTFDYC
jgi:glycerate kinase